jgi:hypothetical protein
MGLPAPSSGWGYVSGGVFLAWCGLASLVAAENGRSVWVGFAALWLRSVLGVAGVVAIGVTVGHEARGLGRRARPTRTSGRLARFPIPPRPSDCEGRWVVAAG